MSDSGPHGPLVLRFFSCLNSKHQQREEKEVCKLSSGHCVNFYGFINIYVFTINHHLNPFVWMFSKTHFFDSPLYLGDDNC